MFQRVRIPQKFISNECNQIQSKFLVTMEEINKDFTSSKIHYKSRSIESLLKGIVRKHGFIPVEFSPHEHQIAYSLYDGRNIEYESGVNKIGKKIVIKTYPIAARILIGNYKNETFYIDGGEVPVYCADDYYQDPFGGYNRIIKMSSDLQDTIGLRFIPQGPNINLLEAHERYDPLTRQVIQYFIDPESL